MLSVLHLHSHDAGRTKTQEAARISPALGQTHHAGVPMGPPVNRFSVMLAFQETVSTDKTKPSAFFVSREQ
jgi:hypothetical protein